MLIKSKPVDIFSYDKYWAECYGTSEVLPRTRMEMDQLGWDSCDIILVTGDAYIDHPSFGMALIGRLLESQGFRVGILDQPDWKSCDEFKRLGQPNLFFGVTAGNMDSMINRYTADRKIRHDDAYTPDGKADKRPDRAVNVYSQRCREAYKDSPIIIGGIEASLRRIAHYDYWSDKVKRSLLLDSKADLLVYGNAERQITEIAFRISRGETIDKLDDIRGTAFVLKEDPKDWMEMDSTRIDHPGKVDVLISPYQSGAANTGCQSGQEKTVKEPEYQQVKFNSITNYSKKDLSRSKTVIRLPSYDKVLKNPILYAHASRILHLETNPYNARALVQQHGDQHIWLNPPPFPLSTDEMDSIFALEYNRKPHPDYFNQPIPAYDMIKFSVNIMRGCFGGCTFCSITEHEGRIIQSRSEESIIKEVENIRDKTPEFKGHISDLGGPTANMYRLSCESKKIEASCRRLSCVYPSICKHMGTNHDPLISLYRKTRELKGIKRVFIASGLRYDLAVKSPEYIEELVTHHVGGYLKIAPEHTEEGPLSKMMKPNMDSYNEFKVLFEKFSKKAGKEQYLIPYFIAAHPGTTNEDMLNLALWLKENKLRLDQVQNFYPSPMASATTMYHTERNPLKKLSYKSEVVKTVKGDIKRRLHKAFLRYHDKKNWPMLRAALIEMNRADLIGSEAHQLIPDDKTSQRSNNNSDRNKNNKRITSQLLNKKTNPRAGKKRIAKKRVH